eukprot:15448325-Alexandrium_andersonii.AAC.1
MFARAAGGSRLASACRPLGAAGGIVRCMTGGGTHRSGRIVIQRPGRPARMGRPAVMRQCGVRVCKSAAQPP